MIYNKQTVRNVNVMGLKALVRADFNVPIKDGVIGDDKRIVESVSTIEYLLKNGAAVIVCSHLGRPKEGFEEKYSLAPVAERLGELLGKDVIMAKDVVGEDAKAKVSALKGGEVMLLENVRFHSEETKNDPEFSKMLADYADIYVNDAFGTAHRAHSSTAGVAEYLPAYSGFLIEKELEVMGRALSQPKEPFVAILGGAKVSDKIGVIENLLGKVNSIVIGGAMAYTFLKANEVATGNSLVEEDKLDTAKELMKKAEKKGVKILLPIDHIVTDKIEEGATGILTEEIPEGLMGVDIGEKTIAAYAEEIAKAQTVVWNGPMGVFEIAAFMNGTEQVALAVAKSSATTIIGGGDSASAVAMLGLEKEMTHISTGGGASLEFLEGLELPGIACLKDR